MNAKKSHFPLLHYTVRNENQLISNKYCMALVFKKRFVLLKQRIHITESLIFFFNFVKCRGFMLEDQGQLH